MGCQRAHHGTNFSGLRTIPVVLKALKAFFPLFLARRSAFLSAREQTGACGKVRIINVQQVHTPAAPSYGRSPSRDPPNQVRDIMQSVYTSLDTHSLAEASESGPGQRCSPGGHREGRGAVRVVPEDGLRTSARQQTQEDSRPAAPQ